MIVPKQLQGLLWGRDISSLDAQKDKNYIIHQVLTYGTFEQIKWLEKAYSKDEIREVFVTKPKKQYTNSSFNFVKNYLLGITQKLPKDSYVKDLPRNIRQ
jgi:hypothetical protein